MSVVFMLVCIGIAGSVAAMPAAAAELIHGSNPGLFK